MGKIRFSISLLVGLLFVALAGCSPEAIDPPIPPDPDPVPQPTPDPDPEPPVNPPSVFHYFVEVADSLELDRNSLTALLGAEPGHPLISILPERKIQVDVVNYYTEDPTGQRVIASGTVAYPVDTSFKGVVVAGHYTVTSDADVPSRCKATFETALALYGYVVVSPDFLGFGSSVNLPHPYLDLKSSGQVSVDLLFAAREYMGDRGKAMEAPVSVVGYSQGAYVALAFQKMVEEEYPDKVTLSAVYAGGGPFEPDMMYDRMVAEDHAAYPCVVPLIIMGADYGGQLGLDYTKLFLDPLLSSYEEWFVSKKYTMGQLNEKLGSDQLSHFMHPDMFTEEINPEFRKVKEALRKNRLTDWTPKAPVYLTHGTDDTIVPYQNSEDAYAIFKSKGCDVHLSPIKGAGHKEAAIPFYLSVLSKLM